MRAPAQLSPPERKLWSKFQENGKAVNEALKRYAALERAWIEAKDRNIVM
jgi:hypothetical protein